MQINETILVLFIFTIILIMGLVVFYRYNLRSVENYRNELRDNEEYMLLSTLPNYLGYSYLGNSENAIDTSKLIDFNMSNLGYRRVIIEVVYPEDIQNQICNYENYPSCNQFVIYNRVPVSLNNKLIKEIPVSLYYPLDDKYKSGILILESYYG